MNVDIVSIIYLIIRISPLLVVSHFVLQSILNMDSKGIVYLFGLVATSLITIAVGASMEVDSKTPDIDCKSMGLGEYENVSMSQVTLGFTYGYLMYIILNFAEKGKTFLSSNIPTVVLFPLLIIGNGLWQSKCIGYPILLMSLGLGIGGGIVWAYALKNAGYKHLALFNGISNRAICSKPSKTKFKCVKGRNA
jgi:hypothetical protein